MTNVFVPVRTRRIVSWLVGVWYVKMLFDLYYFLVTLILLLLKLILNTMEQYKSFKFICSIIIWHDLLHRINIVSKMLQNPKYNMAECVENKKSALF